MYPCGYVSNIVRFKHMELKNKNKNFLKKGNLLKIPSMEYPSL